MRHAIIDPAAAIVLNVVEYDEDISGQTPPGFEAPIVAEADPSGYVAPGWHWVDGAFVDPSPPPPADTRPPAFIARDFLALLTADDYAAIQTAITGSSALGLLWASLLAQGDAPIITTSERFLAGWAGLTSALGAERAGALAAALGIDAG